MFEAHFQTFEDPEAGVALSARLSAFREELARRGGKSQGSELGLAKGE